MNLYNSVFIHRTVVLGLLFAISLPVIAAIEMPSFEEWQLQTTALELEQAAEEAEIASRVVTEMMTEEFAKMDIDTLKTYAYEGIELAQYELAMRYEGGVDAPQDYTKSLSWYKKAAEQGHTEAQFALGSKYRHGTGVREDFTEAVKWTKEAANNNHARAQFNLAAAYFDGIGVRQDKVKAKEWFGKSCDNGLQAGCDGYRQLNK